MKLNFHNLVITLLLALALVPFAAHATDVDYDAVDEAAVPMVAQTSLPQASDQFCRAYRQLLTYDHEEYSNNYHYDNLEGSLVAASIVVFYDTPDAGLSVWLGELSGLCAIGLGYGDESNKSQLLSSTQSFLSGAWDRIKRAASALGQGVAECIGSTPAITAITALTAVACFTASCAPNVALAAGYAIGGICTVCILWGVSMWHNALLFGGVCFAVPLRRRMQFAKARS